MVLVYVTVTVHAQRRDSAVSLLLLSVHSAFFINMLPVVPLAHTPASATQYNWTALCCPVAQPGSSLLSSCPTRQPYSRPVAQSGNSIHVPLPSRTALFTSCCPTRKLIHVQLLNRAALFASGCQTRQQGIASDAMM